MRRLLLMSLLVVACSAMRAQGVADSVAQRHPLIAYYSYDAVLKSMPDYVAAEKTVADLKAKYDAEARRSADDFNAKYESFVEGEKSFAPSIRLKRQQELEELIDRNIAFRDQSRQLLDSARTEALRPVKERLRMAVEIIGRENGFAMILNTDDGALSWANPHYCINITSMVKEAMR